MILTERLSDSTNCRIYGLLKFHTFSLPVEIETQWNIVPTQNSHIFVRSKRCHYLGKCGSLYDCDYWRISHRGYKWITEKEDQESPKNPQIKSCIAIF